MDIIHGYHRSLGRSVARSLARSVARRLARSLGRSLGRSLARSPAQYLYVFIKKNTRQNIFSGGTVKRTSCAKMVFLISEAFPQPVLPSGEGGEYFNLTYTLQQGQDRARPEPDRSQIRPEPCQIVHKPFLGMNGYQIRL